MTLRLLIVDDSVSFLESSRALLQREGLAVAGVASTIAQALRCEEELQPDVVLVDITLADESGFDLAQRLEGAARGGMPAVILVSTHAEEDFAELITASPATGFLHKSELSAEAIRRVIERRPT
jgi:two-component system, NarL family, nitrate/nitrite response regulator NarL